MVANIIGEAPMPETFKTREEHESQTPESFYDEKPVLYFRFKDATAVMTAHHFPAPEIFNLPCAASPEDSSRIKEKIDVMVTSQKFIMFNNRIQQGIELPYQDVPLAAIASLDGEPCVLIHLDNTGRESTGDVEKDPAPIDLFILTTPNETTELFNAIQVCSDLNPDPPSQEDEDMEDGFGDRIAFEGSVGYNGISGLPGVLQGAAEGGLPPIFPGSSGWITAENLHEYFDNDGLWMKGMGPGAGRVRSRDEAENNGDNESNEDNNKRARTIGEVMSRESTKQGDVTNGVSTNDFASKDRAAKGADGDENAQT